MINLQNLFVGFISNYRSLNLRFGPKYQSMSSWTMAEIRWFAALGESLGFYSILERDIFKRGTRVDLVWLDPFTATPILHLERENVPEKILETISYKLMPKKGKCAKYCVGIFDELQDNHFELIRKLSEDAFRASKDCIETLMICYQHIPPKTIAKRFGTPRYKMIWEVRGLHITKKQSRWLEAKCTTDNNNFYTMYLVQPKIQPPYWRQIGRAHV